MRGVPSVFFVFLQIPKIAIMLISFEELPESGRAKGPKRGKIQIPPPLQKNHDQGGGGYLGHVENLKILVHMLLVCFFHFSSWVVEANRKMNFKRKYKNHDRHD